MTFNETPCLQKMELDKKAGSDGLLQDFSDHSTVQWFPIVHHPPKGKQQAMIFTILLSSGLRLFITHQ